MPIIGRLFNRVAREAGATGQAAAEARVNCWMEEVDSAASKTASMDMEDEHWRLIWTWRTDFEVGEKRRVTPEEEPAEA